jgi:hypothetical protein
VRVHRSTKVAVLTTLLACALSACGLVSNLPWTQRNFYGGYHPKGYETIFRSGAAYRTAERRLITTATGFVPLCETDIEWIAPRTITTRASDTDVTLRPSSDSDAAKANIVNIQFDTAANAIETVQYQFSAVSKITVEDGELARVKNYLGSTCLALLRQRFDEGHSVFLVKEIVRAGQVQITVRLKRHAIQAGFDISRIHIKGLKMQKVDDVTIVLTGTNIDIEIFHAFLM